MFWLTGTAAIRVGWRTLASPLLPFLIFVDFGEEIQLYCVTFSRETLTGDSETRRYLVSQSLRRRVADPAAVRNTYELRTQLQDVGERQVADVGVFLTATNITFKRLNECILFYFMNHDLF